MQQTRLRGEVLPRAVLAEGFVLEGQRVPLIGPQGIFKPAYREQCSICQLRHEELLDAAHILPDGHPE